MVKRGGGEILVEAKEDKKNIIITIQDDGAGMGSEQLKSLFIEDNNDSIALININKRLITKYGSKYGLVIESKPDKGTIVTIHIPGIKK